jgi:hypothetical protein
MNRGGDYHFESRVLRMAGSLPESAARIRRAWPCGAPGGADHDHRRQLPPQRPATDFRERERREAQLTGRGRAGSTNFVFVQSDQSEWTRGPDWPPIGRKRATPTCEKLAIVNSGPKSANPAG